MEDVFYINDDKYMSIDDINYLVSFALTLEPLPEVTDAFGYAAALEEYYAQNEDKYSEDYKQLISTIDGKTFLCTAIQLALLEKKFKSSGIDERSLQVYEKYIEQYQKLLEYNHSKDEESTKHI